jgi:hypothetical protein
VKHPLSPLPRPLWFASSPLPSLSRRRRRQETPLVLYRCAIPRDIALHRAQRLRPPPSTSGRQNFKFDGSSWMTKPVFPVTLIGGRGDKAWGNLSLLFCYCDCEFVPQFRGPTSRHGHAEIPCSRMPSGLTDEGYRADGMVCFFLSHMACRRAECVPQTSVFRDIGLLTATLNHHDLDTG